MSIWDDVKEFATADSLFDIACIVFRRRLKKRLEPLLERIEDPELFLAIVKAIDEITDKLVERLPDETWDDKLNRLVDEVKKII